MNTEKKFYQSLRTIFMGMLIIGLGIGSIIWSDAPKPNFSMPNISEDQFKQLETELAQMSPEELEQELLQEIDKLPAKEKDAFYETMEKIGQIPEEDLERFIQGEMSEEELEEFLDTITPEDLKKLPKKTEEEPPKQEKPKKPTPKPIQKPNAKNKQEQTLNTIKAIIERTNSFIVKISALPELPGKIKGWEKKKRITWQPTITWNAFKNEIDQLVQKLRKALEPDKKEYRYLDDVAANETLYNNLAKLEQVLTQYEPKIEEPSPFGLTKMDPKSKASLQKTMSQYTEALYLIKIPQELDKIFEKYEPKAAKLREEEEKARKKAFEESKKPRPTARTVSIGKKERDNGGGTSYSPYNGYYSPYAGYNDDYLRYRKPSAADQKRTPGAPGREPSGKKAPTTKPGEKDRAKDKDKVEKEKDKDKAPTKSYQAPLSSDLNSLAKNFAKVEQEIKNTKPLSNIKNYLLAKHTPEQINLFKRTVGKINKDIQRKLTEKIEDIKMEAQAVHKMSAARKKHYHAQIEHIFAKYKKTFDSVEKQLENINSDQALKDKISEQNRALLAVEEIAPEKDDKAQLGMKIGKALEAVMSEDEKEKLKSLIEQKKLEEAEKLSQEKMDMLLNTKMDSEEKEQYSKLKREDDKEKIEQMREKMIVKYIAPPAKKPEAKMGELNQLLSAIKALKKEIADFAK